MPVMSILLWTLSLLLCAVLLAALARRIKVPSPSLFALGGVLLALLPHDVRGPARAPCNLIIGNGAEQGDVFRGP